jgi:uncharacterized protein with HEPN domain
MDQSAFVASALVFDATVRNLELIGEASTHVPDEVRHEPARPPEGRIPECAARRYPSKHPQVPWRMIIATRNRLIHAYLGVDNDTLWSIVITDVPALLPMLRLLRSQAPG